MRLLPLLILCLLASTTIAQPATVTRVLRTIDFEERRLGNNEDLPMHWLKVEGTGFPHYVNGRLTTDRAHAGQYSFRFDLNGGSLLYRYDPKRVRARHGATYRIEAYAHTTPLEHARARITAYFVDLDGHPLIASLHQSELYAAKADSDPWKKLTVELTATSPDAAFLVVELGLVQPQVYAGNILGEHTLHPQDIRGSAWFDDVRISHIPRVSLVSNRAGNIFRRSDPLSLMMQVSDPFTEDLAVQLQIRDASGHAVYQRSGAADMSTAAIVGPMLKRISIALPDLPPGWYELSLTLTSQGQSLGSHLLNFVRLADDAPTSPPDDRFGVIATDLPFEHWSQLPELLPVLGAGRVKLAVWSGLIDPQTVDPAAFDTTLVRLHDLRITPTACLLDLPPELTRKLDEIQGVTSSAQPRTDGVSWLRLLKAKDEDWHPQLEDFIARHATHIDRWQLGTDGSDAFVVRKGMRAAYAKVYAKFATLIEKPDLAMPWPASYELDGALPATVGLSIPSSVLPGQLPLYIQDLRNTEGHHLSLSLQLLERDRYGRDVQIRDLAQRVIYALSAGAERIDLPSPIDAVRPVATPDAPAILQPQELFLIMRTLMTTLSNARYAGRVPIAPGVEAFLFDRAGQSVIALWDTGREGGVKQLAINLGDSPRMIDLWGNDIPLLRPADDKFTGTVQLVIGTMPVFLTNIDGPLSQLRASVAIDRPLIESTFRAHSRHFKFTNTYPMHITGSFKLRPPQGWTITPSMQNFSLNPGETLDREITIEFPFHSTAGARTIQAEFAMNGEKTSTFQMPLEIKLGLSDVGMQTFAFRDGKDVVIQQIIQNYGDKPIDYSAFAVFPGQARQERLITNLGAGRSIIKRYRFADVNPGSGAIVRVGVKEIDGMRILNDEVQAP